MVTTDPELDRAQLKDAVLRLLPVLPEYAKLQRAYYLALKKEGFGYFESLYLCSEYIKNMLNLK